MVTLDISRDLAPRLELSVRIVGVKKWRIRLWVAKQLFRVAAWISNMGIKFEEKPWYGADL